MQAAFSLGLHASLISSTAIFDRLLHCGLEASKVHTLGPARRSIHKQGEPKPKQLLQLPNKAARIE
jgi:hypothetical protein